MNLTGDVSKTLQAEGGGSEMKEGLVLIESHSSAYSIGNGQAHDAMTPSLEISKTLNCLDDSAKVVTEVTNVFGQTVAPTLISGIHKMNGNTQDGLTVCQSVDVRNFAEGENSGTLQSSADHSLNSNNVVRQEKVVRRLTPLECERLQGFPDGWTDIGDWTDSKGKIHKGAADSPRYKALGNSIALPFWQWMAERMCNQYDRQVTMASLFDGIGGFPLVFSRCGAIPVWASEIEEFPIAVTKKRFPEENL
jgi:DNA (cytosine-5)-methyltransferase 1